MVRQGGKRVLGGTRSSTVLEHHVSKWGIHMEVGEGSFRPVGPWTVSIPQQTGHSPSLQLSLLSQGRRDPIQKDPQKEHGGVA